MNQLFSIGDVARMFNISVSSLRHYENVGLLTPEKVDPDTGYRYYSTRQFEVLNTIRYLRALDMPLSQIADFLNNRDVDRIESKLRMQKRTVEEKLAQLQRVQRKIDNRLRMLEDAASSVFDEVQIVRKEPCRMAWMDDTLKLHGTLEMESPIRRLAKEQNEALVFLGKVGVGISAENLKKKRFDRYDGIFILLDSEDDFKGDPLILPEATCVSIRFHGSHNEAARQYETLMNYIEENHLEVAGFSREITMIDYGFTNDPKKFVTEISVPINPVDSLVHPCYD